MDDAQTAVEWPTGRLNLVVCENCAFVWNASFDPDSIDYTMDYEESQAASPTFQHFARSTLESIRSQLRVDHPRIFEVGCGKGEWLALACEVLDGEGIGMDPSYVPGRVDEAKLSQLEFIVDFFDESATHHTGDLIATRHTLEHVPDPLAFASWLQTSASHTRSSRIFIEVPDTRRIFTEGAFWDVYYEHCSYFTRESLTSLCARTGMGDVTVEYGYSDQYLLAFASADGKKPPALDIGQTLAEADAFSSVAGDTISAWKGLLEGQVTSGRPTIIWGAGSKAVGFLSSVGVPVDAAVDINPFKQGHFLPGSGLEVIGPDDLASVDPELVVVMNPVYVDEIRASLNERGMNPRMTAVGMEPPA